MNTNIIFDYSILEGKIKQYYDTQEKFASAIPMGRTTLNQTLQNKNDFTVRKIVRICELLNIPTEEISNVFFKTKSSENLTEEREE